MKKGSNIWLALGIITGIIIFLGVIFVLFYSTGTLNQAISGTSYLSISKIDNVGKGSEFLIYATGGSSENLNIDFSSQEINNQIAGTGYMVDRGVPLTARINKWQYTYPISLTSNTFKTVQTQDLKPYVGAEASCDLSDCTNSKVPKLGTYIKAYAYGMGTIPGSFYCKCIYYTESYKTGQFLGDLSQLDYNIDFTINGETKSLNKNNPTISLQSGNVRIEYVGNLGTEFQRSKPSYDILYANGLYQHLIPSQGASYSGAYGSIGSPFNYVDSCLGNTHLISCIGSACTSLNTKVSGCINQYNSDKSIGSTNKNSEYLTNSQVNSISFSGNNLISTSSIPSFQPTFKIFVNANWVGLHELSGNPQIVTCAPSISIEGGTAKSTQITVKNVGSSPGQFDYITTCDSSNVMFSGLIGLIEPGETKSLSLSFSGTNQDANNDLKGTCTHKVTDRKSQKSVSCTSSYTVKYSGNVCTPGLLRCSLDMKSLEKCNDLGTKHETFSACSTNCIIKSGTPSCNEGTGGSGEVSGECKYTWWKLGLDGIFCSIKEFFIKLKLLFAILFGFIAGILALSYSLKFTESSNSVGLKAGLGIGALIIFGIAVGIMTWIFAGQLLFLLILAIVLISLGIIRGFLDKIKRITA